MKPLPPHLIHAAALLLAGSLLVGCQAPSPRVTPAAPVRRDLPLQRIAFGSCSHQGRVQTHWGVMEAVRPDLFLFIGDTVYADTEDMEKMAATYARLGAHPEFQSFRSRVPILAIWDDHDYGANDAGREYPKKVEAKEIFLDFFGEPADSPRRARPGNYTVEWRGPPGKRTQIILLDTRWFRDPLHRVPLSLPGDGRYLPNPDETTTILGEAQWAWLEEQLRKPADLRLLVSSIQVHSEEHGWEKWGNFPHERERLFALLRDTEAENLIILSGDRHRAEASVLDAGLGYPLYDVTSSALNMPWMHGPPEPNRYRVSDLYSDPNFGLLLIDWTEQGPAVTMELHHALTGAVLWTKPLQPEQLRRMPEVDEPEAGGNNESITR